MRGAPQRGLARLMCRDEIPNFRIYRRATFATPTLPSPIEAKSLAMLGDNRLRFDKEQRRSPIVPQPREPNPQESISPTETELMTAVRTLQDQKLMSESKNLCLQKGATLGNNLAERKVESAWPGKVTGCGSVNATISICTEFLVGTGLTLRVLTSCWQRP